MAIQDKLNKFRSKALYSAMFVTGVSALSGCSSIGINHSEISKEVAKKVVHIDEYKNDTASSYDKMPAVKDTGGSVKVKNISVESPMSKALNRHFSLTVKDASVRSMIRKMAKEAKLQLVMPSFKDRKVTMNLRDVPLKTVLDTVCEEANLDCRAKDGVLFIQEDNPHWETYRIDYVNVAKESSNEVSMNMSVGGAAGISGAGKSSSGQNKAGDKVTSKQDFWTAVKRDISAIVEKLAAGEDEKNSVVVSPEAGMVAIYGNSAIQKRVKEYLDEMKGRTSRQVLIEASVVEVELSDEYQAGIDWTTVSFSNSPGGSLPGNVFAQIVSDPTKNNIASAFNFTMGVKMLSRFGKTKVVSTPKIMAINNQTAMMKVVDNQVYFTTEVQTSNSNSASVTTYETTVHTVPVGFMMSLTPFVGDNGNITLYVRPTLSRILGYVDDPNPSLKQVGAESRVPVVQEREVSTVLHLKNGQIAVIGGLMQDKYSKGGNGLPGVNELPEVGGVLGYREKSNKKTELVIFIRPTIVSNPDIKNGDLVMFGRSWKENMQDGKDGEPVRIEMGENKEKQEGDMKTDAVGEEKQSGDMKTDAGDENKKDEAEAGDAGDEQSLTDEQKEDKA